MKKTGLAVLVAATVGALALPPSAFAAPNDDDGDVDVTNPRPSVVRIAGEDRIATAIQASRQRGWVRTVDGASKLDIIIARSDDFADAIAATPLADLVNAPVLINPTEELDARVAAEVKRLKGTAGNGAVTVHILGGTKAVSSTVEHEIDAILGNDKNTLRHQGSDRYGTAVALADATLAAYGRLPEANKKHPKLYLTTGEDFADALAAGAAAANNDGIVLLTAGEKFDARGVTLDYIIKLEKRVTEESWPLGKSISYVAVGGPSAKAAGEADIRLTRKHVGTDRYVTAAMTAKREFPGLEVIDISTRQNFAVVSGETYADALVASGFIANSDGPLLLTRKDSLPKATSDYLTSVVDSNVRVYTFGGPSAISDAVQKAITALVKL